MAQNPLQQLRSATSGLGDDTSLKAIGISVSSAAITLETIMWLVGKVVSTVKISYKVSDTVVGVVGGLAEKTNQKKIAKETKALERQSDLVEKESLTQLGSADRDYIEYDPKEVEKIKTEMHKCNIEFYVEKPKAAGEKCTIYFKATSRENIMSCMEKAAKNWQNQEKEKTHEPFEKVTKEAQQKAQDLNKNRTHEKVKDKDIGER